MHGVGTTATHVMTSHCVYGFVCADVASVDHKRLHISFAPVVQHTVGSAEAAEAGDSSCMHAQQQAAHSSTSTHKARQKPQSSADASQLMTGNAGLHCTAADMKVLLLLAIKGRFRPQLVDHVLHACHR